MSTAFYSALQQLVRAHEREVRDLQKGIGDGSDSFEFLDPRSFAIGTERERVSGHGSRQSPFNIPQVVPSRLRGRRPHTPRDDDEIVQNSDAKTIVVREKDDSLTPTNPEVSLACAPPSWNSRIDLQPISNHNSDVLDMDMAIADPVSKSTCRDLWNLDEINRLDLEIGGRRTEVSAKGTQSNNSSLSCYGTGSTNVQWENYIARAGLKSVDAKTSIFYCDIFSCVMVLCNLSILGWSLQHYVSTRQHLDIVSTLDTMLCAILLFEILFRLCLERKYFIIGATKLWNFLDIVVFATMLIELIVEATDTRHKHQATDSKVLRTIGFLRLFRIFRFVKVFRFLAYFRSGRLLVASLMQGYTAFGWFCIFSFSAVYSVSLVITSRSIYYCDGRENERLCEYFGSVWISCLSIYQAMLGGIRWGALYDALLVVEPFYNVVLVLFVSVYYAVFLQVINGILVVHVLRQDEVVKQEESSAVQDRLEQDFVNDLSEHFHRLDVNGNGVLCKDELAEMFDDKEMRSLLSRCNLDTHSAEGLFELIDADKSGQIDFHEFALGCKRYRGHASAVGLERLWRSVHELRSELRRGGKISKSRSKEPVAAEPAKRPSSPHRLSASVASVDFFKHTSSVCLQGPGNQIPKTEMRAMLLEELEDVVAFVRASCAKWRDAESGELLTLDKVNLYHFNYYSMSPNTAAPSITLRGLLKQSYSESWILTQRDSSDSRTIGEAYIIEDVYGTDVQVRILRGMFFPHMKVYLDSGDECGIVEQVENNGWSTSYKELISSSPARPDWFCSHWWGEPISEFVACCQTHSRKRMKNKYWVCAYANRQHELSSDINQDPEETSFRKAMALAEGTLLLLDSAATPFKRIWCDFEIFTTISAGKPLDIVTLTDAPRLLTEAPLPGEHTFEKMKREYYFPLKLLHKGMQVELENGSATMEQDKINILNTMGKDASSGVVSENLRRMNVDFANKSLRGYFAVAAWPYSVKRGLTQLLIEGVDKNLAQIVRADEGRVSLQLTLSGLKEMSDKEMKSIADCLPPRLSNLSLGLENCTKITDIGVTVVARRLAILPLHQLELDFVSCYNLTDASLVAVASSLPASLVSIKVHFDHCQCITQAGVRAFAKGLPSSVKNLVATFHKTRCNETFTSLRQIRIF